MVRNDSQINFDWGSGSPSNPPLCTDRFSTLWTGYVNISATGNWRFGATSDDGFAVDLELTPGNWTRVFSDWSDHAARTNYGSFYPINQGWYQIRVWFYENGGQAVARLRYQGPGVAAQIVPSAALRTCTSPCAATAPTNPSVTNLTPTSAQLNWTSGSGGTSQRLYLDESQAEVDSGCPSGCLISQTGLDPDLQLYNTGSVLTPGETYFWRVVEYVSASCSADFSATPSFTTPADPWTQAQDGNIHANALISFARSAPDGEYHGQYLISSGATIGAAVSSGSGWLAPLYSEGDLNPANNTGISAPTYAQLLARFGRSATAVASVPSGGTLVNGRVYRVTQSDIIPGVYNVPANTNALIFIDGTLTIAGEVRVPATSSLTFIVRDSLQIDKQLAGGGPADDAIQATLIAEGSINTAYNRTGPTEIHRQLLVQGNLISLRGPIYLYRNLGDDGNGADPAELIQARIRNFFLSNPILARPKIFWREVPAGF